MEIEAQVYLPERWANPQILQWARQRIGLQPKNVESLTKISSDRIIRWEKSLESPSLDDLENLAEVYDCPVGYFFLDSPPEIKPTLDLRGLASEKTETLSYETHLSLSKFVHLTDYLASLSEKIGIEREIRIGAAHLRESVETIAQREREQFGFTPRIREGWASPDDAFDFWREAIEARGVFIIILKLNPGEVRGASRWTQHHTPAILVNRNDMEAATGRCFTLLHEWAHLLIKRAGLVCDFRGQEADVRIEHFANTFAAEMLVPRKEFEEVLKHENLFQQRPRWGDTSINRIRHHFWVSKDVIAILLEESGLAPPGFYHSKRAAWDRLKPFFKRPQGQPKGERRSQTKAVRRLMEIGLSMAKYVSTAYDRNAISKLDLADLLDMKIEQAEGFVSWVQKIPGNREVK